LSHSLRSASRISGASPRPSSSSMPTSAIPRFACFSWPATLRDSGLRARLRSCGSCSYAGPRARRSWSAARATTP